MATWAAFEQAAPDLAAEGRRLIRARGDGEALLATVRGDGPPRIHPINVDVVAGGLYAFLLDSPKRRDLAEDGRYALHTHQDAAAPSEFMVRGRAILVRDGATRAAAAAVWAFTVDDSYDLFEFDVASAVLGARPTADDWPPIYTRWTSGTGTA
jgi:hypothetical protein